MATRPSIRPFDKLRTGYLARLLGMRSLVKNAQRTLTLSSREAAYRRAGHRPVSNVRFPAPASPPMVTAGNAKGADMRYERLADIVRLATLMQEAGGLTLDGIGAEFSVSRRTAERMRDAVERAFGPLEYDDAGDGRRHWKLRSNRLRDLVDLSPDELVELETAAAELGRAGHDERAALLRDLAAKLRALLPPERRRRLEPDLEALTVAEGLAMRPGPRPRLKPDLLSAVREAIKGGRVLAFRYLSRMTGRRSWQRVAPHGLLYGGRAYLVGRSDWTP